MIKQLLNSVLAKYRDLSVARRSMICLCLWYRQIIDLPATDKSRYFAQPRPIIDKYFFLKTVILPENVRPLFHALILTIVNYVLQIFNHENRISM